MIHVYAERMSVAFISSAAELSALRITSVVIGSTTVVAKLGLPSKRDDQRAVPVDRQVAARRHHGGRSGLLDDDRALEPGAGSELLARDDRGHMLGAREDHVAGALR